MMLTRCPYCGFGLSKPLECGLSTCDACNQICRNDRVSELLSAAWVVRKENVDDVESLMQTTRLSMDDAQFVIEKIWILQFSHDEFLDLIK